jgi:hypothetical protein
MVMTPIAPTVETISVSGGRSVGRIVTNPKYLGATELLNPPFDFAKALSENELLLTSSVTVSVYSGVDPAPSAIKSGSPAIMGSQVHQMMRGGVLGCVYELLCTVITSANQTLQQTTYFYVEPDLP